MTKTLSRDTDPEFEKVWIEGIRRLGTQASLDRCIRLSSMAWRAAHRAVQRAHPELPPHEQDLLFLEVQYGREISREVLEDFIRCRREKGFYDAS